MLFRLDAEITIYWGKTHYHFDYEEREDYEKAMIYAEKVLANKICSYDIYCNGQAQCGDPDAGKTDYSKSKALEIILEFIDEEAEFMNGYEFCSKRAVKQFKNQFKKYGAKITFDFWDKSKNYEYSFDKENFL